MGGMMRPDMMAPTSRPGSSLDAAWSSSAGPVMGKGMGKGPMLGDHMAEQFMHHMRPPGPMGQEPGFFTDGPMAMSQGPAMGDDWAMQMGAVGPQ